MPSVDSVARLSLKGFKVAFPSQTHTRAMVRPNIEQQLGGTSNSVPLSSFEAAVFGDVTYGRLEGWANEITAQEWFSDDLVQDELQRFCTATEEAQRYEPFVQIANHILKRARGALDGVPKKDYPIPGVTFIVNAFKDVAKDSTQGTSAARRRPDVILTRKLTKAEARRRLEEEEDGSKRHKGKASGCQAYMRAWRDVLQWLEFKRDPSRDLLEEFNEERAKVDLPPLLDGSQVRHVCSSFRAKKPMSELLSRFRRRLPLLVASPVES